MANRARASRSTTRRPTSAASTTCEEADEFQQLLAEPFLSRVLRPLGSRALGSIAGLLPSNYRDGIRQKLVYAGLAGRYRPEEIITAQVLLGVVGFTLALAYSVLAHPSTGSL